MSERPEAPKLDTGHAHSARVYNYWLGGQDNFAADREAAEQAIAANPGIVADVRANREFLVRAEMTKRVNERMRGPQATMRDRAAISRFFDGLDLLEPGVVQPQQWRPDPAVISPDQVTAWCGVARKE
jgi:hypothetical protein